MQNPVLPPDSPAAAQPQPQPPAGSGAVTLQPLDYTSLRAVLAELATAVVPSRFEKAQQSDGHTLQLGLRALEGHLWLELSWLAEAPRLLAIPPPPRLGEGSTLALQLQHGLRGLALVELHQPAWERVVELRFAPRPGDAPERTLVLELMGRHSNLFLLDAERRVIALARQVRDKQSRLRPIGTGDPYQPPPSQAGEPPRLQESVDSWRQRLSLLPLPLGKALLGAYQGTSPALVRQLLDDPAWASQPVDGLSEVQWQSLWRRWQAWLQSLEAGRFALQWGAAGTYRCWSAPTEGADLPCGDVSPAEIASVPADAPPGSRTGAEAARDADADAAASAEAATAPSGSSSAPPQSQAARATSATADAGADADVAARAEVATAPSGSSSAGSPPHACRAAEAQERREGLVINRALAAHYGRILSARRGQQRRHALEARLRSALEREQSQLAQQQALLEAVPAADALQRQADGLLCQPDPSRETIDEAQALYRRARKLRRSVAAITPRIDHHQQRLAGLETSLTFLEQLEADADLAALEEELVEQLERLRPQALVNGRSSGRARRRQGSQAEPRPLELRSAAGLRLQVGRNHRQNEWISLRQARRGDLWFHAQEQPGSHVVLKGSEAPPGEADLQAAADLAAHFSRGRGNRRVPVLMVDAETLQRIPGAEPGTVRHRGGEVLWGEPERARVLLQRSALEPAAPAAACVDGRQATQAP